MGVFNYNELNYHVGHEIECVNYGGDNVSLECVTCGSVLFDFDRKSPAIHIPPVRWQGYKIVNAEEIVQALEEVTLEDQVQWLKDKAKQERRFFNSLMYTSAFCQWAVRHSNEINTIAHK